MACWSGGWGEPSAASCSLARALRDGRRATLSRRSASSAPYPLTSCFSETVAGLPLGAGDADLIAVGNAVGRRDDDAVVRRDARRQFDIAAEIAGDGHGLEQHLVVGADGRHPQAALVEDQGAGRNMQRHGVALQAHADIGIAARHQLAAGIVERKLHPRRAGTDIDRLRRGLDRRVESPVRIFRHRDHGLGADPDRGHVALGHVDIDPQLADVGDHEHRRARSRRRH